MKRKLVSAFFALSVFSACTSSEVYTADKQATTETQEMLGLLRSLSHQEKTLFGHQDATVYGVGWFDQPSNSDVKRLVDDYPAVYGWELGHIELGDPLSIDSVRFSRIREEMLLANKRGGINTISWHLRNPFNGNSSWDETHSSVHAILNDEAVRTKYLKGLDHLCDFLLSLKDEQGGYVPVLFRPFHEHTGSWFWWGKEHCTPDEYKNLWRLTQEHIQQKRDIHHVLYIYSPDITQSMADYFERYPGDEQVDVLGFDCYHRNGEAGVEAYQANALRTLKGLQAEATKRNKAYVFSETGLEGITVSKWFTEVLLPVIEETHPAYALVWRNAYNIKGHHYAPYPNHPAAPDFKKFYDVPHVFFEKDIKAFKKQLKNN